RRPLPRLTTRDEDAAIKAAIQNNPFSNPVAIREAFLLDVCAQTVRSCLHEADIQHRVPAIKERLTDQHRTGRLQFAQQYVGEDPEFWSNTTGRTYTVRGGQKWACDAERVRLHIPARYGRCFPNSGEVYGK
ncbi:putative Transposable element Tc1 transposase-like 53, partial [Homarus americanus]